MNLRRGFAYNEQNDPCLKHQKYANEWVSEQWTHVIRMGCMNRFCVLWVCLYVEMVNLNIQNLFASAYSHKHARVLCQWLMFIFYQPQVSSSGHTLFRYTLTLLQNTLTLYKSFNDILVLRIEMYWTNAIEISMMVGRRQIQNKTQGKIWTFVPKYPKTKLQIPTIYLIIFTLDAKRFFGGMDAGEVRMKNTCNLIASIANHHRNQFRNSIPIRCVQVFVIIKTQVTQPHLWSVNFIRFYHLRFSKQK